MVTVRTAPSRVVVEDVRRGEQVAAADLAAAGAQIERWLEQQDSGADSRRVCEGRVSERA